MLFKLHVTLVFVSGAPGLPGAKGERGYQGGQGLIGPPVSASLQYLTFFFKVADASELFRKYNYFTFHQVSMTFL